MRRFTTLAGTALLLAIAGALLTTVSLIAQPVKHITHAQRVAPATGNPMAEAAVKRWKFKPFQEEGKSIKVVASMNFNCKL